MQKQIWITTGKALGLGLLLSSPSVLAAAAPVWSIQSASQASVTIDPNTTVRAKLPRTLYSFNMRYNQFEQELFDKSAWAVKGPITDQVLPMPGVFYRYPGGILGNHFEWEKAALPRAQRETLRRSGGSMNLYPYFGPAEYLNWIKQTKGTAWWTLNLLGRGNVDHPVELPSATMAESNKNLARFLKTNHPAQTQWLYQLGNELERNHYEWPASKYVSRSRDTINAMRTVDPNAKFVAFMREFDWKYKYSAGSSTAASFFNAVMTGLPMINDFSLHFYYDGKLSPNSRFVTIPDMVDKVQKAVSLAKAARSGNYDVWITEHSKRIFLSGGTSPNPNALDGGVSVGDFLLAMAQVPEVKGAGYQALQGNPRTTFFKDSLKGTPAFWALRVLEAQPYDRLVASRTASPNRSGYPGGYDVRALGFVDATGTKLGVQAINRHNQPTSLVINFAPFKGKSKTMRHYYVGGPAGADAAKIDRNVTVVSAPGAVTKSFGTTGALTVTLPPSSVSTITFE